MSGKGGIQKNVKKKYGWVYWKQHKDTILERMKARQEKVEYNAETRRDMKRHPLNFRFDDLSKSGVRKWILEHPFTYSPAEIEMVRTGKFYIGAFDLPIPRWLF